MDDTGSVGSGGPTTLRRVLLLLLVSGATTWTAALFVSQGHRDWLASPGTNLGSLASAIVAAVVGVAGAYWAARAATQVGVSQADKLANIRDKRLAERDLYRETAREVNLIAERVRDISFSYLGRDMRPSARKYVSREDMTELYNCASRAATAILACVDGDPSLQMCWLSINQARDAFGWALDKVKIFDDLPEHRRSSVRLRAGAYLSAGRPAIDDDVLDRLAPESDPFWELNAPPVEPSDVVPYRLAERHVLSSRGLVFGQTLDVCAAILSLVSESRISSDHAPGERTNVLGIEDDRSELFSGRDALDTARERLNEAFEGHRRANEDPL